MEYVAKRSGRQGSLYKYELLTDAKEATQSYHIGLIDTTKLRKKEASKTATKKAAKKKKSPKK